MTDTSSTLLTGSSHVKRGMAEMLKGGVSRMSDPDMIDKIIDAVSDPVMAKASRGLGEAVVGINVDEVPQPPPPRRTRLVGDA